MTKSDRKTIRFRGKTEAVLETIRVRGRTYFAIEKLSHRGAFRVFDPHAGPDGDFRVLHRISKSDVTPQKIEILRRLGGENSNRNFPGIVDFAHHNNDLFVVVGWVAGTSLQAYLNSVRADKTPRPSVTEVVRLVRGLVHGVSHFHRRTNIIHGDISPANIVITSGTKQLVLIDFGSAWPIERSGQRDPGDGFTQPYAAPERIAKHAVEDFRADAFSITVIAYEMLTLSIPYEGLGGQAGLPNLAAKMALTYRDPSANMPLRNQLPVKTINQLDDCLRRGLRLHPDDRFATSSEWLNAWDSLHFSLKQGVRRSRFEELVFAGLDRLVRLFPGKGSSNHGGS